MLVQYVEEEEHDELCSFLYSCRLSSLRGETLEGAEVQEVIIILFLRTVLSA
jgi:hypothetical protein